MSEYETRGNVAYLAALVMFCFCFNSWLIVDLSHKIRALEKRVDALEQKK